MNVKSSMKQSSFFVILINQIVTIQQGHPKARAIKKLHLFVVPVLYLFLYTVGNYLVISV